MVTAVFEPVASGEKDVIFMLKANNQSGSKKGHWPIRAGCEG